MFSAASADGMANRPDPERSGDRILINTKYMKIRTQSQAQGSVLLVSLLTATVIGIALSSYLTLTSNQNQSVFRSQTWNEGIPVAEAGIEEALTQINLYGIPNFLANNWTWGLD